MNRTRSTDDPADGPANERDMLRLLRDRSLPPARLERIARNPRWKGNRAVRKALASHPHTPLSLARAQLDTLSWKDLSEVAVSGAAHPWVRRQSEGRLGHRIDDLALGETVALARFAPRALIPALARRGDDLVSRALLGNPAVAENDVLALAGAAGSSPALLETIAQHPDWNRSMHVRDALLANPRTPTAIALNMLAALPGPDLQRVAGNAKVPTIVRIAAERRLEARPTSHTTDSERASG